MPRFRTILTTMTSALALTIPAFGAADVSGRVEMPETCSPSVSPAVVCLERIDGKVETAKGSDRPAEVALVNQRGLQFEPRILAVQVGRTVRFANADDETHNVHILTPGAALNQSMTRGATIEYVAAKAGLLRVVCDVHSHMRSFILVSPTPYFAVCRPDGRFRLDAVPDGRYRLRVWHEMGEGTSRDIEVKGDSTVVLTGLAVQGRTVANAGFRGEVRPWAEAIDRIGVLLSEARSSAVKPGGVPKARKAVEDAYWVEFEGADMETAVRRHLGFKKAGEIEGRFRAVRSMIRDVNDRKTPVAELASRSRELLVSLVEVSQDLNRAGVTDGSKVAMTESGAASESVAGDFGAQRRALAGAFAAVTALADSGASDEAASSMTSAYFDAFEPLERALNAKRPQDVRPLEAKFNAIRGRIDAGLRGEALAGELAGLQKDVSDALDRVRLGGSFGAAFVASLVTILREGVEVILLLTMLIALVAKTGQPKALQAIRRGILAAAIASVITAIGLNLLVATAQGRAREQIEGWVMMIAAGVLFYVSYWLISQTESRRWTDFLKGQIRKGVEIGGFGTLGVTAFLAVYREGAETALMYQAMVAGQNGSSLGIAGLIVGLAVGVVGLAIIYRIIRTAGVKLPLKTFFKATSIVLFAMAVVFAGNGVFELQQAGLLKITPIAALGVGIPWLGLHPNIQAVSVQALLLAGAAFAFVMLVFDRSETNPNPRTIGANRPSPMPMVESVCEGAAV